MRELSINLEIAFVETGRLQRYLRLQAPTFYPDGVLERFPPVMLDLGNLCIRDCVSVGACSRLCGSAPSQTGLGYLLLWCRSVRLYPDTLVPRHICTDPRTIIIILVGKFATVRCPLGFIKSPQETRTLHTPLPVGKFALVSNPSFG